MTDDEKLLTMLIRHQLYLDRHAFGSTQEFNAALRVIARNFRRIFNEIEKDNLGELTLRELKLFVDTLARAQTTVYNAHISDLMNRVREFMNADRDVLIAIERQVITPPRHARSETLWDNIVKQPMAATGQTLTTFVNSVAQSSIDAVSKQVNSAYAENKSFRQTLREILGTSDANYRNGLFRRINNWQRAMVPTVYQYVSGAVSDILFEKSFEDYRWIALGDACAVCTERHGQIFTYQFGPKPPAHPNCRCNTVPVVSRESVNTQFSFSDWLADQPEEIRQDMLDERALTLSGFISKVRRMLT